MNDVALTPQAVQALLQAQTIVMLGIPPLQANQNSLVRVAWQPLGQPAFAATEDICFVSAVAVDDDYDRTVERSYTGTAPYTGLQTTDRRTRVWRAGWVLYGPNSFDRARLIRKGLLQDLILGAFSVSNLYLVPNFAPPVRLPEVFSGQWYERVDFSVKFNELVTEYDTIDSVESVEIVVQADDGVVVSDTTIQAPD